MQNVLSNSASSMPPAPNPSPDDPQQGQPINALAPQQSGPAQQAPQGPQQQPQAPAPTHAQTVAALRHFHALNAELEALAADPDLGKADIKSKVIDGATKLVGMRIMTPSQAVMQLGEFPVQPFQQRAWVLQHLQQNKTAQDAVLDHHRTAHAGIENMPQGSPDDHLNDMAGMMQSHYGKSGSNVVPFPPSGGRRG